jgi:hypothetical protein
MLRERGVGLSSGGWIFVEFLAVRDFAGFLGWFIR